MGSAASITKNEAQSYPQYQLLGGSVRYAELKDDEGNLPLEKIEDPYLKYGGSYSDDKKNTIGFKFVSYSEFPMLTSEHTSVLAKVLTKDIFDELKVVQTSKGNTLSNMIQGGIIVPSTKIGISVPDEESYELFSKLLTPAVELVHKTNTSENVACREFSNNVVLSEESISQIKNYVAKSKIIAHRNVCGYSFPSGAIAEDRETIDGFLQSFVETSSVKGRYISMTTFSEEDRSLLANNDMFMPAPSASDILTAAGAARSWPKSRSIFVSDECDASIWVNYEDHIKLSVTRNDADFSSLLERFSNIHSALENHLVQKSGGQGFSWSKNLGYLTSSIQHLGVAAAISVVGRFPNLFKVDSIGDLMKPLGLSIDKKEDSLEISTTQVFGVTANSLVTSLVVGLLKLVTFEQLLQDGGNVSDIQALLVEKKEVIPEVEEPVIAAGLSSQSAKMPSREADPEVKVEASNTASLSAPGSPKKSPMAKATFIPQKSPSSKKADTITVADRDENVNENETCTELKPVEKEAPKKYISAGFMSAKFNNKLTIEIDELKIPGH